MTHPRDINRPYRMARGVASCASCAFFRSDSDPYSLGLLGGCYRMPPGQSGSGSVVDGGHWCGEWSDAAGYLARLRVRAAVAPSPDGATP